jgi:hypothetical protein
MISSGTANIPMRLGEISSSRKWMRMPMQNITQTPCPLTRLERIMRMDLVHAYNSLWFRQNAINFAVPFQLQYLLI